MDTVDFWCVAGADESFYTAKEGVQKYEVVHGITTQTFSMWDLSKRKEMHGSLVYEKFFIQFQHFLAAQFLENIVLIFLNTIFIWKALPIPKCDILICQFIVLIIQNNNLSQVMKELNLKIPLLLH